MPVSTDAAEALRHQLRALVDRAEITDLIDRFARDLDDYTFDQRPFDDDWVRSYFTEDASVEYPVGGGQGIDGVAGMIRRGMTPFQRTHHVTTNYVIDLDGDRAALRWNLLATHVHAESTRLERGEEPGARFTVGDYFEGEVVRTPAGWRFSRQTLHVTWAEGTPPPTVVQP